MASEAASAWYALVRSSTEGFAPYERMRAAGVKARIAPPPHGLQACCGMALLIAPDEADAARALIEDEQLPVEGFVEVENAIDPHRDRYC